MDRERLVDMEERLKPVRRVAIGILGVALLAAGPWIGLWTLLPLAVAAGLFAVADARLRRSERPEYLMFAAWALSEVTIARGGRPLGRARNRGALWIAIPVVTLSARFCFRGVLVGVAIAIGLVLAVGFGTNSGGVLTTPPWLWRPSP